MFKDFWNVQVVMQVCHVFTNAGIQDETFVHRIFVLKIVQDDYVVVGKANYIIENFH